MIMSACSPEVLLDPQSHAGNPTDPTAIAAAYAAGPIAAQVVVTEKMLPVKNKGQLVYAPGSGIEVVVFKPDMANELLMLIPIGGTVALIDGPSPILDIVAVLYSAGKAVAILVLFAVTAYTVEKAFEGVRDLTTTIEVGYLPLGPDHHTEHDVAKNLVLAEGVVTSLTTWITTGPGGKGPDNSVRCLVMKAGQAVVRFIVWSKTHVSATGIARGTLMWWHAAAPAGVEPLADIYTNKSAQTLLDVPTDLRGNGNISMEEWNCNQFPPTPLLPAGN